MPPSAEKLGADELAEALLESLACETRVRAILPLHASDWQAGALALAVLAVREDVGPCAASAWLMAVLARLDPSKCPSAWQEALVGAFGLHSPPFFALPQPIRFGSWQDGILQERNFSPPSVPNLSLISLFFALPPLLPLCIGVDGKWEWRIIFYKRRKEGHWRVILLAFCAHATQNASERTRGERVAEMGPAPW